MNMDRVRDLELILRSRMPIVVIETGDETRVLELLRSIVIGRSRDGYLPLFRWTITDGLQRLDIELEPQIAQRRPFRRTQAHSCGQQARHLCIAGFSSLPVRAGERQADQGHMHALSGACQTAGTDQS